MFDVSFSELVLILIVGLIVFGPEKLPEVVRSAGLWIGKLRRSFNNIRSEIEREVGVEELKRDLHNQAIMDSLKDVQNDLRGAQQHIEQLPHEVSRHLIGQPPAANTSAPPAGTTAPAPTSAPASMPAQPASQQHHSS